MNLALPLIALVLAQGPSWQERTALVVTSAVRMAPQQYRDTYLPGQPILTAAWYAPTVPLRWNDDLALCARTHAEAILGGCPFRHDSCDGTSWITRLGTCYPGWISLSENGASGFWDPQAVVNGWLLDSQGGVPAPDGSNGDGHRRSLMSSVLWDCGIGFAEETPDRFWVQDFGRRGPFDAPYTLPSPIVAGSHLIRGKEIVLLANWYSDAAPVAPRVILNGQSVPLALHLGTPSRGTYRAAVPVAGSCRSYHFEMGGVRYPLAGELRTFGDGCANNLCLADFDGSGTVQVADVFSFLEAWLGGNPAADADGSGELGIQDVPAFLAEWMEGC